MASLSLILLLTALLTSQVSAQTTAPAPAPSSTTTSSCKLTPELTEGPYYVNGRLLRSDITEGQAGIPFNLSITVVNQADCQPLANTFVDIWHASAVGVYSGFGAAADGRTQTNTLTFLRGIVLTNSAGVATFKTIFPGWYQGRVTHIHVKVHVPYSLSANQTEEYVNSHVVHTGQLFFDESVIASTALISPYSTNTQSKTALTADNIYTSEKPDLTNVTQVDATNVASGLTGSVLAIVSPGTTAAPSPTVSSTASPIVSGGSSEALTTTLSPSLAPSGSPASAGFSYSLGMKGYSCILAFVLLLCRL